jgi:hypothetical protein
MKKVLIAFVALACAFTLSANAAGGKKQHKLTDEQKAVQKELMDKYDANKDGKLDKQEKAKMTKEEKDKYRKTFGRKNKKESTEK